MLYCKNYSIDDFFNLSSNAKQKPEKTYPNNSSNQHMQNSYPQTTPNGKLFYTNMEVDMNYPNEVKPIHQNYSNYQNTLPPSVQIPYDSSQRTNPIPQTMQHMPNPNQYPIYNQPYQMQNYQQHKPKDEYVEFKTKNGKTVKFKAKKEKKEQKAKIFKEKEEKKSNEQAPVEAIPKHDN